jgi:hypothetical protein
MHDKVTGGQPDDHDDRQTYVQPAQIAAGAIPQECSRETEAADDSQAKRDREDATQSRFAPRLADIPQPIYSGWCRGGFVAGCGARSKALRTTRIDRLACACQNCGLKKPAHFNPAFILDGF